MDDRTKLSARKSAQRAGYLDGIDDGFLTIVDADFHPTHTVDCATPDGCECAENAARTMAGYLTDTTIDYSDGAHVTADSLRVPERWRSVYCAAYERGARSAGRAFLATVPQ